MAEYHPAYDGYHPFMKFKMQNLRVYPTKSVPSLAEQAWSHEDR